MWVSIHVGGRSVRRRSKDTFLWKSDLSTTGRCTGPSVDFGRVGASQPQHRRCVREGAFPDTNGRSPPYRYTLATLTLELAAARILARRRPSRPWRSAHLSGGAADRSQSRP